MVAVGAALAYGVAVGGETIAAAALLSAGFSRRPSDREALGLGALASLTAATTIVLCALEAQESRYPTPVGIDWPFALASATALVPAAWGLALLALRDDHDDLHPAHAFLIVVALFAANRYDALVAAGTLDTAYVQPFVLPAFLLFAAVRAANRVATAARRRVGPGSAPTTLKLITLKEVAATDERNRIARDLHDSVSQTLYSIAMLAEALPRTLERDLASGREQALQIRTMTIEALGNLRMLLLEMRHPATESADLGDLLLELAGEPGAPVVVELGVPGGPDLPSEIKLAAYRVAQEALMNAHRHALPTRIVVRLEQRGGALVLSIVDDGVGFDVGAIATAHHGLEIMRERAEQADADLSIESRPGHGTRVILTWPHPTSPPTPEEAP